MMEGRSQKDRLLMEKYKGDAADAHFGFFPRHVSSSIEKIWSFQRSIAIIISQMIKVTDLSPTRGTESVGIEFRRLDHQFSKKIKGFLQALRDTDQVLQRNNGESGFHSLLKIKVFQNVKRHACLMIDNDLEKLKERIETSHAGDVSFVTRVESGIEEEGKACEHTERNESLLHTYLDRGFNVADVNILLEHEKVTEARERDMVTVSKSISEIYDLFVDTNVTVMTQGTILDRIDHNLHQTHHSIHRGKDNLYKALKYQNQIKYKLVFLLLFILIFAALVSFTTRLVTRRYKFLIISFQNYACDSFSHYFSIYDKVQEKAWWSTATG